MPRAVQKNRAPRTPLEQMALAIKRSFADQAADLGLKYKTFYAMLSGERRLPITLVSKLARFYGVPVGVFIPAEEDDHGSADAGSV